MPYKMEGINSLRSYFCVPNDCKKSSGIKRKSSKYSSTPPPFKGKIKSPIKLCENKCPTNPQMKQLRLSVLKNNE